MNKIILMLIAAYSAASHCFEPNPRELVRLMRNEIAESEKEALNLARLAAYIDRLPTIDTVIGPGKTERVSIAIADESLDKTALKNILVSLYEKKVIVNQIASGYIASKGGAVCSVCLNDFPAGKVAVRCNAATCKAAYCGPDCEKEVYRDHQAACPIHSYT